MSQNAELTPSSISLLDLEQFLDDLLKASEFKDFCPNGIQVEGRPNVFKIVTGVSACQELFRRAHEAGANAILVHHGLFWTGTPYSLTGVQYQRVRALIDTEISLLAYHLPLDAHPVVGNNAVAAQRLGLTAIEPFTSIGFKGRLPVEIPFAKLLERIEAIYGQKPLAFAANPEQPVTSVGIISGGAQKDLHVAMAEKLDVFITGEASEWAMNLSLESGTRFVSAGHYATERFGVQVLGETLSEQFGIEVEFIDIPNPI